MHSKAIAETAITDAITPAQREFFFADTQGYHEFKEQFKKTFWAGASTMVIPISKFRKKPK